MERRHLPGRTQPPPSTRQRRAARSPVSTGSSVCPPNRARWNGSSFKHTRQVDNTVKFQWDSCFPVRPQLCRGQGGGTGAKRWPARGPLWWGSHPPPGSPARPGALRASNGALAPTPEMAQVVRNLAQHGLSRLQLQRWQPWNVPQRQEDPDPPLHDTPPPREASPRKQARSSPRQAPGHGIAREISHGRKYVALPAVNRTQRRAAYLATQGPSDIFPEQPGHFPWDIIII